MSEETLPLPEPGERVAATDAEAVLEAAAEAVDPMEQRVDMTPLDSPRRLLLVHAHPDDEVIGTGATMARYAATGDLVALVTCTRGEEGEIVVEDLAHLASDREDALGPRRAEELAVACEALGVRDHRFLGGPGRWRDSGMMGAATNDDPRCFWQADIAEPVRELVGIMRQIRPQVVITYDDNGGYGHPDHIRAHQVTVAAVDAAGDPSYEAGLGEPWAVAKLYWTAVPKSALQRGIDHFRATGGGTEFFEGVTSADELPFGTPDELVTTEIDGREQFPAKMAALRAHRSQVAVNGVFFALADQIGTEAFGSEHFVLARGERGAGSGEQGWEDDLFAGVG